MSETGKPARSAPTRKKAAAKTASKRATARARGAKPKAAAGGKLRVKQVRSGIGHAEIYRRTLRALGIRHHQGEVVVPDNPSTRGMVFKVRHLVQVTSEEA
jgi:large subunit ribosomal protein L30